MTAIALSIAGSDPSGGAGIQADLKTFHQHGVYGMSVVTLLTVQNTQSVSAVELINIDFILAQFDAVCDDLPPQAVKTGAIGSGAAIIAIAERLAETPCPIVVDPVMISKHGSPLLDQDAIGIQRDHLLPRATLLTPNMHEASALAGFELHTIADMERAAPKIAEMGPRHVLIKGGRLPDRAVDVLFSDGEMHLIDAPRVDTTNTHGTGCAYSAAITARLATGESIIDAIRHAKTFITEAIRTNPNLGRGYGPLNLAAHVPKLNR